MKTKRCEQKLKRVAIMLNEREMQELIDIKEANRKTTLADTIRSLIIEAHKKKF